MSTAAIALAVSILVGCFSAYGVVTARRALRWQQARDAERREQRVHIHFEHAAIPDPTSEGAAFLIGGPQNLPRHYRLRVVVVNRSETSTVWIRSVHIEQAYGEIGLDLTDRDAGAHRLEPGEPLVRDIAIDRLGRDFSRLIAKVHVAPDEWIESPREELHGDLLKAIGAHNSRGALDRPPDSDDG